MSQRFGAPVSANLAAQQKLVLPELRQLRRAIHGLVTHEDGRIDLGIAVNFGVEIEHELAERAFHSRERAFGDDEAGARQFRGGLEIHQTETFADFEMFPRFEGKPGLLSHLTQHFVAGFVRARGHRGERQIGKLQQERVERDDRLLFLLFEPGEIGFERGDLGLETLRARKILRFHRLPDLLRGGVAAFLYGLQFGDRRAAQIVECDDFGRHRVQTPAQTAVVEDVPVVAYPFEIEHNFKAFYMTLAGRAMPLRAP